MSEEEKDRIGFETPDKRLEKLISEMENIEDKEKLDQISKSLGSPPLLRHSPMSGEGDRDETPGKSVKKLQQDVAEIKLYLKEILETLKSQEG